VGFKLAEGKGLREGWDSKELWKSVENEIPQVQNRYVGHSVKENRTICRDLFHNDTSGQENQ
jgi:hypothetical protein